jgi:hypothetical protein
MGASAEGASTGAAGPEGVGLAAPRTPLPVARAYMLAMAEQLLGPGGGAEALDPSLLQAVAGSEW